MTYTHPAAATSDTNRACAANESITDCDTRPSAVLLVARDRSLDESCRRTLSDAGVECVVSVRNSESALQLLGENQIFDAVVIGVSAGDVEAVKLAKHMQRYRSDTPTLVVSPMSRLPLDGAELSSNQSHTHLSATEMLRSAIRSALSLKNSRLRRSA